MTQEELRDALKRLDRQLSTLALADGRLVSIYESVSDLGEYMLKAHARMDRLQTEIDLLKVRAKK